MRIVLFVALVACKSEANVTVTSEEAGVSVSSGYQVDEGSTLDLAVEPTTATASVLPPNSTLADGIFTFKPDYSQAGLFTVAFTDGTTTRTVAIRVNNVIHTAVPAPTAVSEGGSVDVTLTSDDPAGTIIDSTADVSGAPGATYDSTTHKLSFAPSWRFLDSQPPTVKVPMTFGRQTLDVVFQVSEATSFKQELEPLFLLPLGTTGGVHPDWESAEAHNCLSCHDSASAQAGMDFHPGLVYGQLVGHALATTNNAACQSEPGTVKRVVANDLANSLWFMKISGTDGKGNPGVPCGLQEANTEPWNWFTVTDQSAWDACGNVNGCRQALDCGASDVTCKLGARLVRKASVWILAGAPNN